MSYPRYQRARDFKHFIRTAGDLTLNSNVTWADLPTIGTTWDAVLAAQVGDVIEAGLSGVSDSAATIAYFDVVTIVSGAAVNSLSSRVAVSNTNKGAPTWYQPTGGLNNISGAILCPLVAGDISGGTVTLRVRYQTSSATNRNLHATVDYPFHFYVKNLGPADPN